MLSKPYALALSHPPLSAFLLPFLPIILNDYIILLCGSVSVSVIEEVRLIKGVCCCIVSDSIISCGV